MILRLPIPTRNPKFLTADEIKANNEWCARLAQLQLLGAMLEPETEPTTTQKTGVSVKHTLDAVPTPFAEPPVVKCEQCGNGDIKKFSHVVYEYRARSLLGFNREGEISVADDSVSTDVSHNDNRPEAAALAGEWLVCHACEHEQRPSDDVRFDWY